MIHAYDKSYLSAAQKNLARMLDYLVNDLHYPLETAWQWFVTSELSARFEQGDCSVLVGLSGVELARAVLEQAGEAAPMQKPSYAYDRSPEYWTGWALAYYQWLTSLRFAEIEQAVSITKVRLLYTPYHEMDVRQFADKMNELYRAAKPETNLKAMRTLAGLSQSELAGQADVPVRTHPAVRTATEGHQQSTSRNAASPCACAELQRGGSDGESSTAEFYRKARK